MFFLKLYMYLKIIGGDTFIFFIKEWDIEGYKVFLFLYGPRSFTLIPTMTLCILGNFSCFLSSAFFFKINFF